MYAADSSPKNISDVHSMIDKIQLLDKKVGRLAVDEVKVQVLVSKLEDVKAAVKHLNSRLENIPRPTKQT